MGSDTGIGAIVLRWKNVNEFVASRSCGKFIVPDNRDGPHIHETAAAAINEARRLAAASPGQRFFVFVAKAEVGPAVTPIELRWHFVPDQ